MTRESLGGHIDVGRRSFATFNGSLRAYQAHLPHIGASIIRFDNWYPFMFVNPSPNRISEINLPERQPGDAQLVQISDANRNAALVQCAHCACVSF